MASETDSRADGDALPSGRAAGVAIALASLLSVAFMATHPTVHAREPADFVAAVGRQAVGYGVVSAAARAVGGLGCVAGGLPVVALLSGHLPMNVHGVLAFILAQTVWSLAVAAMLIANRI